jgi:hypothetical protein
VTCPFPRVILNNYTWTWASEICKFYEPLEKWGMFVTYVKTETWDCPIDLGECGYGGMSRRKDIVDYIQISAPFNSEQEAKDAIPPWMKDVVVRKIDND